MWIAIATAVAVVLVGLNIWGLVAIAQRDAQGDPVPVVAAYLDAIAAGEAERANEMIDLDALYADAVSGTEELLDLALMSDADLADATERITVGDIELVERIDLKEEGAGEAGEQARVRAEFSLAGEDYEQEFLLTAPPHGWFAAADWQLQNPLFGLAVIEVTPEFDGLGDDFSVVVGQKELPLERGSLSSSPYYGTAIGYPAVYEAELDAGEYFTPDSGEVVVTPVIGEAGQNRLNDIQLDSIFGRVEDPELTLEVAVNDTFRSALVESGLDLAQACATADPVTGKIGDRSAFCPAGTLPAVVEACDAEQVLNRVFIDTWVIGCDPYRGIDPLRGTIAAEIIGDEATLTDPDLGFFKLGPYRFTSDGGGAPFEAYLGEARFEWRDGVPVVISGDFELAE